MSEIKFPDIKSDESFIFTYDWDIEFVCGDKSDIKVHPLKIKGINKNNTYYENILPVLIVKCDVSNKDMCKLRDNAKDIVANIAVIYKKLKRDSKTDSLVVADTGIISSGTYVAVFSGDSFKSHLRREEIENYNGRDAEGFQTNPLESERSEITMYLNDVIGINTSKMIYNECFDGEAGITAGSLIQYIATNTPCDKILIDKPDNENTYQQDIIIPPTNFIGALQYIQTMIGCYQYGLLVFYDDGVLYILNKFANDHEVEKGETNVVHAYIADPDKNTASSPIYTVNDSKESMYIGAMNFRPSDTKLVKSELFGDNVIFSSFRQGLDAIQYTNTKNSSKATGGKDVSLVLKHNNESHSESGTKNILDYDELNNPFNVASEFNAAEATAEMSELVIPYANIIDFKPNKYMHLHFKDNRKDYDYGGKWFIIDVRQIYMPTKMSPDSSEVAANAKGKHLESFNCGVSLLLSRCKPDSK